VLETLTSDTAASASAPLLFFLQITLSGTLNRLQHLRLCLSSRKGRGPLSHPCWLTPYPKPKMSLRLRISFLTGNIMHVVLDVVPDPRPSRLVDPAAMLHCHSTPHLWMMHPVCSAHLIGTQHLFPVFGNLPFPAEQTLPTQAAGSLHNIGPTNY